MAFFHGVKATEVATALIPPAKLADGIPVFIGTAPVQQVENGLKNVNQAVLCNSYKEAVAQFGYSEDWDKYTLCEAMYAAFMLYRIAPIVFINVLDVKEHKTSINIKEIALVEGKAELPVGILIDTLKVKSGDGQTEYKKDIDYLTSYDDTGKLQLIISSTGALTNIQSVKIDAEILDPERVTKSDIIGGIDINTGKREGTEAITDVFLKYNLIPGMIGAPGFTDDSEVGAVLTAKGYGINGVFKAQMIALDLGFKECKKYTDAVNKKKSLNYYDPLQTVCWLNGRLGTKIFHGSTIAILRKALTDQSNDGVPYESPSNLAIQIDAAVLDDGTEVWLDLTEANYLNSNGICTFLNFVGGWKLWGNRTGCYPSMTDPKDTFISLRAMMSWWGNREILTYWQKVDRGMNKRLLTSILNSMKVDINGLVAAGALVGGKCVLYEEENPTTELIDGKIAFHTNLGFVTPAEQIEFKNEFDTSYIETLVSSLAS